VRFLGRPPVRPADALALSSRNAYLGAEDRERAVALSRALRAADSRARAAGGLKAAVAAARAELEAAGVEPLYLEARDPDDLTLVDALDGRPVLLAVAARVGGARLIDNVLIQP
ncbi:MAG: pantoate--beta-alanine ligase, partial [Solirubrobacterales bacterium]